MSMELRLPPMAAFHMPGIHPGMAYQQPRPGWVIRPMPSARVRLFGESENSILRAAQRASIQRQEKRMLRTVMEINAAPVVLEQASFRNAFGMIDGRIWLNGAAGNRMRNKFDQQNDEKWLHERLTSAFRRASRNAELPLPVWKGPVDDLPVAIELKNGFNYYHFTTETLGCLAPFASDDSDRPINLHLPQENMRGFLMGFIQAVFPTLARRVRFLASAQDYDRVRALYSHRHYLYQVDDPRVDEVLGAAEVDMRWLRILRPDAASRKSVSMGSYDSSLRLLREHALRQVPRGMAATMPRLVWMGRDESGEARVRGLTGHERLLEALAERGFQQVAFEHLSPIEQIAQMQAADILIAPHGAGLANMLYARPDTLVIEIGSRQTQVHRWGDFLPCAHVAACRYDTVFADVVGADGSDEVPAISQGLLGLHIGQPAKRRILALVDEALGGTPDRGPARDSVPAGASAG